MKKILLLFLLISLSISFTSLQASSKCSDYDDVSASDWYCEGISYLQNEGVLTKQKYFSPAGNLNRAEALKVLFKLIEHKNTAIINQNNQDYDFFNLKNKQWFTKYYQEAYVLSFIKPINQKFSPQQEISKAEFVILFIKIFNIPLTNQDCQINAYTINDWININPQKIKQYMCTAKQLNFSQKLSAPNINRAVAMTVLYKGIR